MLRAAVAAAERTERTAAEPTAETLLRLLLLLLRLRLRMLLLLRLLLLRHRRLLKLHWLLRLLKLQWLHLLHLLLRLRLPRTLLRRGRFGRLLLPLLRPGADCAARRGLVVASGQHDPTAKSNTRPFQYHLQLHSCRCVLLGAQSWRRRLPNAVGWTGAVWARQAEAPTR